MGNHSHDCPYCHQDKRLTSRCCARAIDEDAALEERLARLEANRKRFVEHYGFKGYHFDGASLMHLAQGLKRLVEERRLTDDFPAPCGCRFSKEAYGNHCPEHGPQQPLEL